SIHFHVLSFFFQAEDGIRDRNVTGVQTCALPIFSLWDFNNGFGINMFSLNLFDPFLMLLYLFGVLFGAERIYGILVFLQILRIQIGRASCRERVLVSVRVGLVRYRRIAVTVSPIF